MKKLSTLILLTTFSYVLIGCRANQPATEWNITEIPQTGVEEGDVESSGDADSEYIEKSFELIYPSLKKSVCDPLGDGSSKGAYKGLIGDLRLINELGQLPVNSDRRQIQSLLSNYQDPKLSYEVEDVQLFLSLVNVPERSFLDGFSTQGGDVLQYNGETLFEFFNINLKSNIKIEQAELVGEYEFASLSDDGSKLSLMRAGETQFQTYFNSNIEHSPKFICSPKSEPDYVDLQLNQNLPLELNYFQGPREHIALQLFWRKKKTGQMKSNLCGVTRPSLDELKQQGWEIVPSDVFNLPGGYVNPCADGEVVDRITNLKFYEDIQEGLEAEDLIGSYKVYILDIKTGAQVEYQGDIQLSGIVDGKQWEYTLTFAENQPIMRDVDKKLIVKYQKLAN